MNLSMLSVWSDQHNAECTGVRSRKMIARLLLLQSVDLHWRLKHPTTYQTALDLQQEYQVCSLIGMQILSAGKPVAQFNVAIILSRYACSIRSFLNKTLFCKSVEKIRPMVEIR